MHTTRRRAFHEFSYDNSVSSSQWQPSSAQVVCHIQKAGVRHTFHSTDLRVPGHREGSIFYNVFMENVVSGVNQDGVEVGRGQKFHVLHHVSENHSLGSYIPNMPDLTVLSISALIKLCFPIFLSRNTDIQNKESRRAKHRLLDCSSALDSKTVSSLENMMCDLLNN